MDLLRGRSVLGCVCLTFLAVFGNTFLSEKRAIYFNLYSVSYYLSKSALLILLPYESSFSEEAQAMAFDLDVASRKFFPVQDFSQTIKERLNCPDRDLRFCAVGMRYLFVLLIRLQFSSS